MSNDLFNSIRRIPHEVNHGNIWKRLFFPPVAAYPAEFLSISVHNQPHEGVGVVGWMRFATDSEFFNFVYL